MAAGLGFKTFTSGEVLTAADTNGYLMQGILVFANASARTAAVTSPQEGQYSYLKDTNALEYYDGAAWVGAPVGDITAVTAGKGLTGGGSSGDVTVSLATTAKGDLVVGTGASTAGVLSVSSDGSTIVADSAATTGLRWQAPVAVNPIINGGFDVWQRGTSFASGTRAYTADRFEFFRQTSAAGATLTRQTSGLTSIQYCARVSRDSGNTATNILWLTNSIETANSIPYQGKTITFSFYARAGANYSSASSILNFSVQSGTGTDQNINGTYTGAADVIASTNATLTTTWQRFTYTGTVSSTATELAYYFDYTPVGTAGAADYYEITGIQIEVGSVATPFKRSGGTIQGELAACQRYYQKISTTSDVNIAQGWANSTTNADVPWRLMPMRVSPTSVDTSNYKVQRISSGVLYSGGTITMSAASDSQVLVRYAHGSAVFTTAENVLVNMPTGYVAFNAEL